MRIITILKMSKEGNNKVVSRATHIYVNMSVGILSEITMGGKSYPSNTSAQNEVSMSFQNDKEFYDWCTANPTHGNVLKGMYEKKKAELDQ